MILTIIILIGCIILLKYKHSLKIEDLKQWNI